MVSLTFLNHLNLSYNNLSGQIPTGNQLETLNDPTIYQGNELMCGAPVRRCNRWESAPFGKEDDVDRFEKLWMFVAAGVGFFVGFWGVCGSLVVKKQWRDAYFGFVDKVLGFCWAFRRTPKGYYNDLATLLITTNDEAVRNVFSINTPEEFHVISLTIFFILYCILGLITIGIVVPSGLFLPIILMGSAYGRILGMVMEPYTKIDKGLHAVLGAASLMAGSMRMTVSLCVIFLELTNNLLLLPITMLVLVIAKTVGDCFNPSIYDIILELKGLPFLEAHPEPWVRNITVGELSDYKPGVFTLSGIEKVGCIVEVLKNTTHNGFPVVDVGVVPAMGTPDGATELHGLVLTAHLILVLKKWFLQERRRAEEWEVREKFTSIDMDERGGKIEEVTVTKDDMEMYVDLHPLSNTTPYTVIESMSVAKAMVLFRQVGLRHMLIIPKYQAAGVHPVVGILTWQDLRAHNILNLFPQLEQSRRHKKGH